MGCFSVGDGAGVIAGIRVAGAMTFVGVGVV